MMLFVDGENFTLQAQKFISREGVATKSATVWVKDVAFWPRQLHRQALPPYLTRVHYYTSAPYQEDVRDQVVDLLKGAGVESPHVIRKVGGKAKGVDVMLTADMVYHASCNHYDTAILLAGDGDFAPLVETVNRLGKDVLVWFLPKRYGLSEKLIRAADCFVGLEEEIFNKPGPNSITAPLFDFGSTRKSTTQE